jgi:hypothetical protein
MQRKEWAMIQETVPAAVEQGVAPSDLAPLEPPAPAEPQARPKISRLAVVTLALSIGILLALVLIGLDGWLMSQNLLETHDLPEMGTWVLSLPTLLTPVLAFMAKRVIAASGGALTGRGLVNGSLWLSGVNGLVLLFFFSLLFSSAGETYMCGGG